MGVGCNADELAAETCGPKAFLDKLVATAGAIGKKLIIGKIRPRAEEWLTKNGMSWEKDALPFIEMLDTMSELEEMLKNPGAFFEQLANKAGATAINFIMIKVKKKLNGATRLVRLSWH